MSKDIFESAKAAEICRRFRLPDEAAKLLEPDMTPARYVDALIAKGQFHSAVEFLAHALPKREAVWWACLCLGVCPQPLPPKQAAALRAAVRWVVDPTDPNRQAAYAPAQDAGLDAPAGAAGMAAYWSSGSALAPDQPAVPPAPTLTAQVVRGAVAGAAALFDKTSLARGWRQCLALGLGIAHKKHLWTIDA